jgi:hypothetical protein
VTLSHFDVRKFKDFGFVVLRNVLTGVECRAIASEFASAFRRAYPDLMARTTPAWLPGLADATPCSAALTVDDDRLWGLSRHLLGGQSLPCPPEVAWLRGITPWHYDDPLGLRAVKFLVYVAGRSSGLRLLPMSHTPTQRETVKDFLATSVGAGSAARTPTEAAELDVVPSVPITVEPGDVVAIDLHVWHCYSAPEPRILWAPEYLAWPVDRADSESLDKKFVAVASAGAAEDGRSEWPVWRDWLRADPPTGVRRQAVDLLRRAGAFDHGRDQL